MEHASTKGYSNVIFETDSLNLIDCCQDVTRSPWSVAPIIEELQSYKAYFPSWSWNVVPREANQAVDWVALWSRLMKMPDGWLDRPPMELTGILSRDGLPCPPQE